MFHHLACLLSQFCQFPISSAQAEPGRWWNCPNQSQTNPAIRPDRPPCTRLKLTENIECVLERDGPRPDLHLAPVHARVELGDVGEAESAALGAVYAQPLVLHHVDVAGEDDPAGAHVVPRYYVVACGWSQ